MPPTDLYLVRHAQSTWNAAGRWQGQADPPLSELGRGQARLLGEHFPETDVTHVFASDLVRAHETAKPIAARFGLEIELDRDLREIDVGTWSGSTRDEIAARDAPSLERYFQGQRGWEGGETYEEHEIRCDRAVARLDAIEDAGSVIAVTHGGTLRAMVLSLLEIDHSHRWRFTGIGHASMTHLTRSPHGWRLRAFNATIDMRDA
ncbi:MAG: fructose-2,6-bisphosphatase [Thermoleophilia bacterium]|nr:fructose-2,6-bisphosphatase [Thermoleophilia bacterium]